jgi:hypothetical protein
MESWSNPGLLGAGPRSPEPFRREILFENLQCLLFGRDALSCCLGFQGSYLRIGDVNGQVHGTLLLR